MKLRVASCELRVKCGGYRNSFSLGTVWGLCGLITVFATVAPAMGQRGLIRFGNGPMVPMQGFQGAGGDDAMGGVYVRDSAIAMEKLALAQRMERLHEW